MLILSFFIVGFMMGFFYRKIDDRLKILEARKPETGVTPGSYHRANENNVNQAGETGFVTPKTPQRLEWEEQERLREEQLRVKVK